MTGISAEDYINSMQAEVASRKSRNKKPTRLDQPGQAHTFITKPFTVVTKNAGFEMMDKGHPDAQLTGARPQRPDRIIQDKKADKII